MPILWPGTVGFAKRLECKYYLPRKACRRGHVSLRLVSNWVCLVCQKQSHAEWKSEHKQELKEYLHIRYMNNREERYAQSHAWRKANPELVRSYRKKWESRNPEYVQLRRLLRSRAERKGQIATAEDIKRLELAQHGRCYWCHGPYGRYHIDHIWPLSKGGSNGPENLALACQKCNQTKGAKLPYALGRLL